MSTTNINEEEWVETNEINWINTNGPEWIDEVTGSKTKLLYSSGNTYVEWTGSRNPEPCNVKQTAYPTTNTVVIKGRNEELQQEELIYIGPNLVWVTPRQKSRAEWEWKKAIAKVTACDINDPLYMNFVDDESSKRIKTLK